MGGGHALLGARPDDVGHQGVSLPHHPDEGHIPTNDGEEQFTMMITRVEMQAEELYYAKSAVGENYKTYRNMELPRHRALMPSRCPEDCMGGDIVEGPVVFLAGPSHVVRKQERGPGKLALELSLIHISEPTRPY